MSIKINDNIHVQCSTSIGLLTCICMYIHTHVQFNEQKTMGDCRLRWENHLRPSVYRGPWSKEEEKRLVKVANQHQCTDWQSIAEEIGVSIISFTVLHGHA